jgi:hypothetical protein
MTLFPHLIHCARQNGMSAVEADVGSNHFTGCDVERCVSRRRKQPLLPDAMYFYNVVLEIGTVVLPFHLVSTRPKQLFAMRFCNTPLKSAVDDETVSLFPTTRPYLSFLVCCSSWRISRAMCACMQVQSRTVFDALLGVSFLFSFLWRFLFLVRVFDHYSHSATS